jgi:hypothetical protein
MLSSVEYAVHQLGVKHNHYMRPPWQQANGTAHYGKTHRGGSTFRRLGLSGIRQPSFTNWLHKRTVFLAGFAD